MTDLQQLKVDLRHRDNILNSIRLQKEELKDLERALEVVNDRIEEGYDKKQPKLFDN